MTPRWAVPALLLLAAPAVAEEAAVDVVAKAWQRYRQGIRNEREVIDVLVEPQGGAKEKKRLTRWTLYDEAGEDKVVVKFSEPALDRGLGLLVFRHAGGDEQWLKLPSQSNVRKISVADESKFVAGTDFTYEDVRMLSGERTGDFLYDLGPAEGSSRVVTARPREGTRSGYGRRVLVIDAADVVRRISFFGPSGSLLKTLENRETTEERGSWRPLVTVVTNAALKRETLFRVVSRATNEKLPSRAFSRDALLQDQ